MKMVRDVDLDKLSDSVSRGDGMASSTPALFNPMRRKLQVPSGKGHLSLSWV